MNSRVRSGLFAFCALTAFAVFAAEPKPPVPPVESGPAAKVSIAGDYAGRWKSSGESAGKLQLKLKQDGESWTAEATFTFDDAEIATKMKSIKVEGVKVELIFDWEIQGSPGQSKITGEATDNKLHGTYESTSRSNTSTGTWTVTRI